MKAGATVACVRCVVLVLSASVLATAGGCHTRPLALSDNSLGYYELMADQIEYPDVDLPLRRDVMEGLPPHTLRSDQERTHWDLTLQEAVRIALENSQVMRDIGASVLQAPASSSTVFDPAIQETDPRSGTEAALSAFDADLGTSLFFGRNQRIFNNFFPGGGSRSFEQQTGQFQADVTKQTAAGTLFTVRNLTTYDRNNSAANLFSSAWNANLEAEFRHPLAQGGGTEFNRIAGPNATPGNYNGVLISRIRTDITLTDFEQAVRDLVADVERTYWNLHFAYRNLDATIQGRDAALRTWQVVRGQFEARVADREQESLARERYFAAQAATENALSGTADASSGGVFAVQ